MKGYRKGFRPTEKYTTFNRADTSRITETDPLEDFSSDSDTEKYVHNGKRVMSDMIRNDKRIRAQLARAENKSKDDKVLDLSWKRRRRAEQKFAKTLARARAIGRRRDTGNKRIKEVAAAIKSGKEREERKKNEKERMRKIKILRKRREKERKKQLKASKKEESDSDIDVFADSSDDDSTMDDRDSMLAKNIRALALG